MKEKELREIAECKICHKPFGHTGIPMFWRLTIERYGVNLDVIRAQDGLAQMLGSSELANVMGPDKDMAKLFGESVKVTICETCMQEKLFAILTLWATQ